VAFKCQNNALTQTNIFQSDVKVALEFKTKHRQLGLASGDSSLRDAVRPYDDYFDAQNTALKRNYTVPLQTSFETTKT